MESTDLSAKAVFKLTKLNENGEVVSYEEHEVDLTSEEVKQLWQSQQQV
jgi:23S rRNA U2552 (ribose-2'-O)-methylase RlmE/FtsJ